MRRDGKRKPHIHPAGVALDRRVEELLDLGKSNDLVELASDLVRAHAEDRAVEIDVLAARQLRMKSSADLEQAGDAADDGDAPLARLGDARQDLQERGLAGAVAADDAEHLAALNLEAHVLQRPEFLGRRRRERWRGRAPRRPPVSTNCAPSALRRRAAPCSARARSHGR